jgi:Mg-chelatase subunit ChlD
VVLDQGGKNRFTVLLARDHFSGPVVLKYTGLPRGVRIDDATVPEEADRAEAEVQAESGAEVGEKEIVVNGYAREASSTARVKLRVEKPPAPQVDLLFVLDVTGSMQNQIDGVRESIFSFARELQNKGLDFRIGMLAFRDRVIGEEPVLLTFEDGPFTRDLARFQNAVGQLKADGGGDDPESSLDALVQASRQPFRATASKVLLLITDAEPKVPDKETKTIDEAVEVVRNAKVDQLHLIVADSTRAKYQPFNQAIKGNFFSLNSEGATSSDFAKFLPVVGREVARTTGATQAPRALAAAAPAPLPIKGVQSSQEYEAGSQGRLLFLVCLWTALVGAGICLALMEAQARFVRHKSLGVWEICKGLAGGGLAGLLGGIAGQLLFLAAVHEPAWEVVFRIFGWVVLGALAGLGLSFFVPNLSRWRGAAGGAIGGALGAVGFLGIDNVLHGSAFGDVLGRFLGAGLLGLAVGLMVALIEQMSRRVWLEVASGGQVRTVALGTTPVFLGSDAGRCQVWVPQTPARAVRYLLRDGKVEVLDIVREQAFLVERGYRRLVGQAIVTVCGEG